MLPAVKGCYACCHGLVNHTEFRGLYLAESKHIVAELSRISFLITQTLIFFVISVNISLKMMKIMNMRPSSVAVKASASASSKAAPATANTVKALNITKANLVGSQGGSATRNLDGVVSNLVLKSFKILNISRHCSLHISQYTLLHPINCRFTPSTTMLTMTKLSSRILSIVLSMTPKLAKTTELP